MYVDWITSSNIWIISWQWIWPIANDCFCIHQIKFRIICIKMLFDLFCWTNTRIWAYTIQTWFDACLGDWMVRNIILDLKILGSLEIDRNFPRPCKALGGVMKLIPARPALDNDAKFFFIYGLESVSIYIYICIWLLDSGTMIYKQRVENLTSSLFNC